MKKKQITETKKITSCSAKQRTKDFMRKNSLYNPDLICENFAKNMDRNKLSSEFYNEYQEVAMTLGLDTHLPVADSFSSEYRSFLINIIKDLEKECDSKTVIEKSLIEIVASSHVRILSLTKLFNCYANDGVIINNDKTSYYKMIGTELDRAHRQLNSSILTLRQIKTPISSFNITAKTAFVSQNQQINNYDENNERQ